MEEPISLKEEEISTLIEGELRGERGESPDRVLAPAETHHKAGPHLLRFEVS
jgi:hypothetical protein